MLVSTYILVICSVRLHEYECRMPAMRRHVLLQLFRIRILPIIRWPFIHYTHTLQSMHYQYANSDNCKQVSPLRWAHCEVCHSPGVIGNTKGGTQNAPRTVQGLKRQTTAVRDPRTYSSEPYSAVVTILLPPKSNVMVLKAGLPSNWNGDRGTYPNPSVSPNLWGSSNDEASEMTTSIQEAWLINVSGKELRLCSHHSPSGWRDICTLSPL